ncbi:SusC/RagA family TonB-linked outer membrane protein [Chitinophaga sp. 22620]|uniref:SusC/RagA family TonB-linked outer membrane protein n=1 Tax=Chitinophaga sp. 22620 TaxID=3453952 RepID=UPI003F835EDC
MNMRLYIFGLAGLLLAGAGNTRAQQVEDSVQVAYGRVQKKTVTYSISTAGPAEIANKSVYTTGNALYGLLPGLTVQQRTGEPGNDAPAFLLRGVSTTKTNTPLMIVDGIERDINDVQLEDITSIAALKDAAAAIMYGIRGANGVIVVTTKRGIAGKLKINAKVEQGFQTPVRVPQFVSSAQYVQLYNQALRNDGLPALYTPQQIEAYQSGDRYFYPDVDWQSEIARNFAPGTKANVNVSGGDKIATYYVSLGYFRQGGIYKNTGGNEGYSTNQFLDNISFRSNIDLAVNRRWSFSMDIAGRIYQENAPASTATAIWDAVYQYPSHLFPVFVEDGVYGGTAVYPDNPAGLIRSKGYRKTNNRLINTTLSTRYDLGDFVKGLSAGARYSSDNFYTNVEGYNMSFSVRELLGQDAEGKPILSPAIGKNTNLTPITADGNPTSDAQDKRNTFETFLEYSRTLANRHQLNATLVYHQDRLITGAQSPYNYQFVSGRVNYGFNNRYFAEIGASYSGTEAFPKGNRFGFFPAVSAAWLLSEEKFLKNNPYINLLKLRVSAGTVGNSAVGERFSDRRQYSSSGSYSFGNTNASQSGLYEGVIPNPDFTWETALKYDAGIDLRLLQHLDVSLTYFFQERKDILVSGSLLLPEIFGGSLPSVNAGITRNQGFEASLFYSQQKKDWGYRAGLNVGYVKDKVQYLPEAVQPYSYLYKAGQPVNQPYMLEAVGFFNSEDEIRNSPEQTFGPVKPGDIRYKDQNNDNRIDGYDIIPMQHSAQPAWNLGLLLSVSCRGFDLGATFEAQLGRSIYLGNEPYLFWPLYNYSARISTYPKQFWTEETKQTADYPRLTTIENKNNYRPSSFWYVNGDFLRLRSLDLGYTLPAGLLERIKISQARVFVRGMNLFTLDHLHYADPEVQSGYPVMKSYNAGISLQF